MLSLEEYKKMDYPNRIEKLHPEDGGGYYITYPDLPGCSSDGETVEEAIKMGEDARICWIETAYETGREIPLPFSYIDNYKGRITVRVPKTMHKELIEEADEEGISLNQYLIYIISKGMRSGYDIKTQQKSNL
ncbi:MAG TPA: toxin-antitoxin system HicB family antitoxin [Clostridiaceae bacterium]|jgi:antitoxin HicB|nr:toxin-antitoxin system HicB family antitoxin [Clostridiaceae bacterium]